MSTAPLPRRLGPRALLSLAWVLGLGMACAETDGAEVQQCDPGQQGCECLGDGSCAIGLICDDICVSATSETSASTETSAGDGDGDPSTTATTDGDGDGDPPTDCHPLMVDCPTVGTTCTWDGQQFQCLPGITKLGDSCVPDNPQCVSGFCAPMAMVPGCPSTHCCAGFCNLDMPNCSVAGTSCVSYFPPGVTTAEVGACLAG